MTYDELVTQVNDYIENSFPVDNINTFKIGRAHV